MGSRGPEIPGPLGPKEKYMDGFVGVQSMEKSPQVLTFDGRAYHFGGEGEADHVRILPSDIGRHAETRMVTRHAEKDGRTLPHLIGRMLFKIIPLDEALKAGAALEENPVVVRARELAAAKAEDRKKLAAELEDEITAKVIKNLEAQGWKPPKEKKKEGE